jgi:lipopolysaccharide/colanic/teichoic acid biosynthesis glycosyltransferase
VLIPARPAFKLAYRAKRKERVPSRVPGRVRTTPSNLAYRTTRKAIGPKRVVGRVRTTRLLNILVALFGIVVAAPLMILIALAVAGSSRGPVFYRQKRVGLDRRKNRRAESPDGPRPIDAGGKIFWMYKFRTMSHCPIKNPSREVWASAGDRRVTLVGSILRKHRLDELPQLINVLRGEMNVVGPRPEQPDLFQELSGQVHDYRRRQRVLPGITGWAQVNHSYDRCVDDVRKKVALDLEYIRRRSPVEDLRIMVRTLPVMVGRKGAQ